MSVTVMLDITLKQQYLKLGGALNSDEIIKLNHTFNKGY